MQPYVRIQTLSNGLGVKAPNGRPPLALTGTCSAGTVNMPATFARVADLTAAFGAGPLVEASSHAIQAGNSVVVCRAAAGSGDTGAVSTPVVSLAGSSSGTITLDSSPAPTPVDDLEVVVMVTRDSTVATTTWVKYSVDNGATYSPEIALGTAVAFPVPGTGTSLDLGAGTLKAGSKISYTTTAPSFDNASLNAAIAALANSAVPWRILHIVGPVTAGTVTDIQAQFAALESNHKWRQAIGNTRVPNHATGETESAYLTAMTTAFSSAVCDRLQLCSGDAKLISAVTGKEQRRPYSYDVASLTASVQPHIDVADVNLGPQAIRITDDNGNPTEHDESLYPGLSDLRLTVARSWDAFEGVYCNDPLLLSQTGSDFVTMPIRRVVDLAAETSYPFFVRRLNRPVLVNAKTGKIDEGTARAMELGCEAAIDAVLGAEPMISGRKVNVSRTDDILSTKTLHVSIWVVPLAYLKQIEVVLSLTVSLVEAA